MKRKLSIIIALFFLAGCATVHFTWDWNAGAAAIGKRVYDVCNRYAPEYLPILLTARDGALVAIQDESVNLGSLIGDVLAAVQAMGDHGIGRNAMVILDATAMLMEAVNLEWKLPAEYEKARRIVISFLSGMKQ